MTISTSSQASAGSLSLFDGTEDVLECSAKSNHSVSESSQNTGRESLSSETSENSMEPDTEERGFSPEAFLASHSVAPGSERARKMTVSSGLRCVESYGKHNPNGCWQRMFLASLVKTEAWFSSVCLLTWKMQATKRSRLLFRLAALALPIEEIGSGLLHTPAGQEPGVRAERLQTKNGEPAKVGQRAYDKGTGRLAQVGLHQQIALLKTPSAVETEGGIMEIRPGANAHYKLRDQIAMLTIPTGSDVGRTSKYQQGVTALSAQIAMLPTTRATDWKNGGWHDTVTRKDSLNGVMSMLPTPATRDYKGANGPGHMQKDRPHMDQLPNAIAHGANPGLKLQPGFALWMMGYPEDWCDLKDGE